MSVEIPLQNITVEYAEIMERDLTLHLYKKPKYSLYLTKEDKLYLPFHYAINTWKTTNSHKTFSLCEETNLLHIKLFPKQEELLKEVIPLLSVEKSVLIAAHTGFGKTLMGYVLGCLCRRKTLYVYHRNPIRDAWINTFAKFGEKRYQLVTSKTAVLDSKALFYLINITTIRKKSKEFFLDIGTLILDEVHAYLTDKCLESFTLLNPEYVVALSASPWKDGDKNEEKRMKQKYDTMDKALPIYFGKTIWRRLFVEHDYYIMDTTFSPSNIKYNVRGEVDWNDILMQQAYCSRRNFLISELCMFLKERRILVICKRKRQASLIHFDLTVFGESVDCYFGSEKKFDSEARILVTTYSKSGVGFDHSVIDCLIIAADVEQYIEQYAGRLRHQRRSMIIDFRDEYKQFRSHLSTRVKWFKESGGKKGVLLFQQNENRCVKKVNLVYHS